MSDLEQLSGFLGRFREFRDSQAEQQLKTISDGFSRISNGLAQMKPLAEERDKNHAPNYNVFRILGLSKKEEKLHTPLLVNLLNPRGSHGQGRLFLIEFLKLLADRHSVDGMTKFPQFTEDQVALGRWQVRKEFSVTEGRADIVISNATLKFLLVIENKIYSSEGDRQLQRYSDWLDRQKAQFNKRTLVFLTPSGRKAKSLEHGGYFTCSYKEDIAGLLHSAIEHVQAEKVSMTLRQYLSVVENLVKAQYG